MKSFPIFLMTAIFTSVVFQSASIFARDMNRKGNQPSIQHVATGQNVMAQQATKQKPLLRLSEREKESEDSTTEHVSLRMVQKEAKKSHNRNSLGTEMKVSETSSVVSGQKVTTQSRVLRSLKEMRQEGAAKRGGL